MSDADALMRKALELTPKGDPVEVAFFMIAGKVDELRGREDAAYEERSKVVALLASLFPSGIAKTAISGWHPEWHGCVYVDLPTGQASWHYHESHAHLFAHLPPYGGVYDGHSTDEKYDRVRAYALVCRGH